MENKVHETILTEIKTEDNKKYCKKLNLFIDTLLILFLIVVFSTGLVFDYLWENFEYLFNKILIIFFLWISFIWIFFIPIFSFKLYKKWTISKLCIKKIIIRWLIPIVLPLLIIWWCNFLSSNFF